MPEHVPGLDLCEVFYRDSVRPALRDTPHSAALLGPGSEVLGYDTERSTDHDWGARVLVFVEKPEIGAPPGARVLTVDGFFREVLGVGPTGPIEAVDWLTFSEQSLLEVTRGRVFHDGLGTLEPARARFAYYPDAVWRHLLACQWRRIAQEEHLPGRAAEMGDELGSRVIVARLVRDVMRLAFLQAKTYAPYPKWFGRAFLELEIAERLGPPLARALDAANRDDRQTALCEAFEIVAESQNALGIHPPVAARVSPFFDRPFLVIHGDRFADAIRETIDDTAVRALPPHLGSADQISDSTDVLSYPQIRVRLRDLYLSRRS